jgi:hypothetical protein
MKGPLRPQSMQTATPFTTSAATASCVRRSRRVENSIPPCEDWSVTIWPAASRARYAAWRSA